MEDTVLFILYVVYFKAFIKGEGGASDNMLLFISCM